MAIVSHIDNVVNHREVQYYQDYDDDYQDEKELTDIAVINVTTILRSMLSKQGDL